MQAHITRRGICIFVVSVFVGVKVKVGFALKYKDTGDSSSSGAGSTKPSMEYKHYL